MRPGWGQRGPCGAGRQVPGRGSAALPPLRAPPGAAAAPGRAGSARRSGGSGEQEPGGGGGVGGTRAGPRGHLRRKGQPGIVLAGPRLQHAARTDTAPARRVPEVKVSVLYWGQGGQPIRSRRGFG
ncbi:small membrane A-kinase anchor protein isoform X2 [Pseudopipra pipra]|uniref:small membrane A-kinase anchor protein isoform X2 n=1 Tax=Pseudopipra pipra TaxID=415032 RepID=UPI0031388C23